MALSARAAGKRERAPSHAALGDVLSNDGEGVMFKVHRVHPGAAR